MTPTVPTISQKGDRNAFNSQIFLDGIDRAMIAGRPFAVMVVSLDRFRQINNVFGCDTGSRVLREAATRIGRCIRDGDLVSCLGGDEIALLAEGIESPAPAAAIADGICTELCRPFAVANREAYVSPSIGIALFPGDGQSADELLRRADIARSHAKKTGGGHYQFYAAGSEASISGKLDLEARLHRALRLGELELHYQPQMSLADGAVNAVEALLRWNDPELGWVPPAQLIPIAEESGLIHAIGEWILETAGAQAKAWRNAGMRPVTMCINVSALQVNAGLVETVSRMLAQTGLPPSAFELEITESVMLAGDAETEAAVQSLRALGIEFAIDDFGTGHATFAYLKRLPVRTLKVDGSFVRNICNSASDVAIVAASVCIATNLGLRLVAEGVETAEQRERLRKLGCHDCQGYYIGGPMPAAALEKVLGSKHRPARAAPPRLVLAR